MSDRDKLKEKVADAIVDAKADLVADAALMKALGSVAWLADQEYRNDHSDSTMIATGLLRELRDGYQRIAEQRCKPTIGIRTDAMDHLGEVLNFFANLDEDHRCDAFEKAVEFYNKHNPDSQIQGEPGFTWYICQRSPLGFDCRGKMSHEEFTEMVERIRFRENADG